MTAGRRIGLIGMPRATWGAWRAWCQCGERVVMPADWNPEDLTVLQCVACGADGGPISPPSVDDWTDGVAISRRFDADPVIPNQMHPTDFPDPDKHGWGSIPEVPWDDRHVCPSCGAATLTTGNGYRDCLNGHRLRPVHSKEG